MTVNSRRKGASFERQIVKDLCDHLGEGFTRNLDQTRDGGHDIKAPEWFPFALELKRYAKGSGCKPEWWAQAAAQAKAAGKLSAVIYQFDRRPVRCAVHLSALAPGLHGLIEMDFQTFCMVAREVACNG